MRQSTVWKLGKEGGNDTARRSRHPKIGESEPEAGGAARRREWRAETAQFLPCGAVTLAGRAVHRESQRVKIGSRGGRKAQVQEGHRAVRVEQDAGCSSVRSLESDATPFVHSSASIFFDLCLSLVYWYVIYPGLSSLNTSANSQDISAKKASTPGSLPSTSRIMS
ncbi:hypothetical protein THAOC_06360 [Thalassiosira oceanica]|uniref:Uncharacterized protein n=1 Tax=Thalassiosira oceanica TaxID=159749 RepID=K0T0H2_THAOC|nr:hypothetical protein THAOC_06360 [Thalassiosira oceanica]|eukprot:EJK72138.1 hypothetical protein THAOC_06360 [Thalassiosira oceanica]